MHVRFSCFYQARREVAIIGRRFYLGQAANATNTDTDRSNLNAEVDQLKAEIDRVVGTTTFNNKNLLNGGFSGDLQIGAFAGENLNVKISNMGTIFIKR